MNSGSFASSYVETVRLLDLTCHNFRTLSVRHPRNSVTKYPLFLGNTLTPAPRNNAARYSRAPLTERCRSVTPKPPIWINSRVLPKAISSPAYTGDRCPRPGLGSSREDFAPPGWDPK